MHTSQNRWADRRRRFTRFCLARLAAAPLTATPFLTAGRAVRALALRESGHVPPGTAGPHGTTGRPRK